jgi:hypothetical protein
VEQDWHQREMALADRQFEQNLQGIQQILPKIGAGFAGP